MTGDKKDLIIKADGIVNSGEKIETNLYLVIRDNKIEDIKGASINLPAT
jgi:hypothetical protein